MQRIRFFTCLLVFLTACGTTLKLAPVKVQPIHMTIDVNLHDSPDPDAAKHL
jgi:hypothetical protein